MNKLELRDIHLPDAVSWWPPAMGWWVLLLLFILIAVAVFFMMKKMKQVSVRKTALTEFVSIKKAYQQHHDKTLLSQQLSQLLRKILLSSHARHEVASVIGEQWLLMLNQSHPKGKFELEWLELLTSSAYKKQADFDADSLLKNIEQWLSTYPKRHLL